MTLIEDILHEAEAKGLRHRLLYEVEKFRKTHPKYTQEEVYELVWSEVSKSNA